MIDKLEVDNEKKTRFFFVIIYLLICKHNLVKILKDIK